MLALAISNGDVIILVAIVAIPLAAIAFIGAGGVYDEIGKGDFAMDHSRPEPEGPTGSSSAAVQEAEIRQMLEAKSFRQQERGEGPLDIEAEMRKLTMPKVDPGADPALVEEVRQLVVARNQRRMRKGEEPLDIESEIARQLNELDSMGH